MGNHPTPVNGLPNILLVEDDDDLRAALRFALELDGFEVWSFSAAEPLLQVPELPAHALLILDEKLPGMDGLAMLETLRARDIDLPVVLITTPGPRILAHAKALGVPIIEKPLVTDDLARKIRQMVRSLH